MEPPNTPEPPAAAGPVWGRRLATEAGQANVAYCAGWDVRARQAADLELLPYDIWTNRAHCVMLTRAGVIPPARLSGILQALDRLEASAAEGNFQLNPLLEDIHLNIEDYVERQAGAPTAGLMHTARSRNDQVATDMRLFLRDRLLAFVAQAIALAEALSRLARKNIHVIMPGLTHHQPAAWTTFGHWAASHAAAFTRDAQAMLALHPQLNVSPLGAAASFGTSWPIDRQYAASLLGFDAPQTNTLDCVTNRSEFESRAAGLLAIWAHHAATLSQDLILFSSPPWHILRIGDAYVTGSSIMPQKRNPDFAEVTKAKAALAGSTAATLLDLTRGDPSGYNREQQWSKYLILDLFAELGPAPIVLRGALESLTLDKKRMRQLMADDYLEAADIADYLAQTRHIPFRSTYRLLGESVRVAEETHIPLSRAVNQIIKKNEPALAPLSDEEQKNLTSPDYLLERRASLGGPSSPAITLHLAELRESHQSLKRQARNHQKAIAAGRKRLERAMRRYAATPDDKK